MLREEIEIVLDRIRPMLMGHGGNIEIVGIDEEAGKVSLRFTGVCTGCPSSAGTIQGISQEIKSVPGVKDIEFV